MKVEEIALEDLSWEQMETDSKSTTSIDEDTNNQQTCVLKEDANIKSSSFKTEEVSLYEDYDVSKLKAERTTSLSSIQQREKHFSEPPRKKKRLLGTISQQTELLQKACSFLESSEKPEENPIIVKLWYEKLQNLDPLQRLYAEKAINDILFEASLGTLERNSVKINE
ncbi:uncharacterized protein LOC143915433 isoform X2 [Arctopsyche grandis]|uniref:uncharacterized protein LOC143915433 isoform X2 n=1 Tax=Arctopsyche grandis TaxID=121162 RepID=UPI00406D7A50